MLRTMLRSRSSRRALVSTLALLVAASATTGALSGACREPTQITLEVRTDLRCADRVTSAIVVGTLAQTAESLTSRPPAVETTDCTESGNGEAFIGSLVVVPSGDDTGEVAIKVVAGVGIPPEDCTGPTDKRCITARRVRKYVSSTKLVLPVLLADACRGVPCGADETCSRGRCVSVRCEDDGTCDPPPASADGGVTDATSDAPSTDADATPPDASTSLPFEVALGDDYGCALRNRDGAIFCWGNNSAHQAGQATGARYGKPTAVALPLEAGERAIALRAAGIYATALSDKGRVFGWGNNESGPLGPGSGTHMPFAMVDGGATALEVGQRTSCYLASGQLHCVGQYVPGDYALPAAGLSGFCVGTTYLLALGKDGNVFGAFDGTSPALPRFGDASLDAGAPGQLGPLPLKAREVHCGGSIGLLVNPDGTVTGWGNNTTYVLTGDRPPETVPVGDLPSLKGFTGISTGIDTACAVKAGDAYCWGVDTSGQIVGTVSGATHESTPKKVPGIPNKVAAAYPGGSHSCAQLVDGTVYCWGANDQLQLGSGSDASTPVSPGKVQGLDP